jgi:hypothetical protein
MKSKISKGEWFLIYAIAGIIDIIQFVISFTGVGIAVNEVADPIIGITLLGYFQIRGVSMIKHPSRLLSLLGVAGLEAITGGIAPAWVVDVWYINRTVKAEEAGADSNSEVSALLQNNIRKPLYENGIRNPQSSTPAIPPKLNINGIRPPNGGLK